MKRLFLFFPFLYLLFLLARAEVAMSQDLGRHIRLGEIIWTNKFVPETNLFSYTMPNQEFVNHHWLGEVFFYLLSLMGGVEAILVWKVLFVLGTFGVVFYISSKMANVFWAVILSIPYLFIFSYRFDARPEIFSFFYLSAFLLLIYLFTKKRSYWYLFLLLPIQVLWVNTHIYFFVGIVVYCAFVLSEYVLGRGQVKLLLIGGLLCLCLFVSPYGLAQALVPLRIFSNYGYSIVENQNVLFLNSWFFIPQVFVLEILSFILVICAVLTYLRRYLFWYMVGAFGVVAAFGMVRNLPLFVMLTFPLAAVVAFNLSKKYRLSSPFRSILVTVVIVVVGVHVVIGVRSPAFGFFSVEPGSGAVDFIEEKGLSGPIFNNFDNGSYLIYRLYPREKVFVDGRPEAYTVGFFDEYKRMQTDPVFFEKKVAEYNIRLVVFSTTDITPWAQEFFQSISSDPEWMIVYSDSYSVVLVEKDSENYLRAVK